MTSASVSCLAATEFSFYFWKSKSLRFRSLVPVKLFSTMLTHPWDRLPTSWRWRDNLAFYQRGASRSEPDKVPIAVSQGRRWHQTHFQRRRVGGPGSFPRFELGGKQTLSHLTDHQTGRSQGAHTTLSSSQRASSMKRRPCGMTFGAHRFMAFDMRFLQKIFFQRKGFFATPIFFTKSPLPKLLFSKEEFF